MMTEMKHATDQLLYYDLFDRGKLFCIALLIFSIICKAQNKSCLAGNVTKLGPIITYQSFPPELHRTNIDGPSIIRVPDWLKNPLGRYYLYFADHKGIYIDLAYADNIQGPYKIAHGIKPLSLHQAAHGCSSHIASPDVHVQDNEEIIMYYHCKQMFSQHFQPSFRAYSKDGLHFTTAHVSVGMYYFRRFKVNGTLYAFAKHGNEDTTFLKWTHEKIDGEHLYEPIDTVLPQARHSAVYVFPDTQRAVIAYTIVGEAPESIYFSEFFIQEKGNGVENEVFITFAEPCRVLWPELTWEGAQMPLVPSHYGGMIDFVNQVRDPYIFCDSDEQVGSVGYPVHEVAARQSNRSTTHYSVRYTPNSTDLGDRIALSWSTAAHRRLLAATQVIGSLAVNGDYKSNISRSSVSDLLSTGDVSSNNSIDNSPSVRNGSSTAFSYCYLLYSYAGEAGLALAQINWNL